MSFFTYALILEFAIRVVMDRTKPYIDFGE